MMKHKVEYLDLVTNQELAVLALHDTIKSVAKILHLNHPVRQIGYLNADTRFQVGRTDLLVESFKIRIPFVFYL